ncbi:hypothetical protein FRC17_002552 [Serendipita sp. 399]|nr:hypothetical protein FRC17_002552 [Serendipita sp. 399]
MESGSSPPYSAVLLLDRKIREIDPMRHAEPIYDLSGANSSTAPPDWRKEIAKAFSKGLKYMLLMSLHKTYFSYALLRPEENTISGKLALSISAMYEGATGLLECAQITSRNASWLQARYSPSWIHYQTSCLVLYAFPMYLPSSPKAEEAMKTADLAVSSLFQAHGRDCGVAAAGLPSLLKCQEKAKASMAKWRANQWTHPMASKEGGATATAPSTAEEGLPTEVFFNEKLVITNSASSAHNTSHDSRGSTPSDMVATASPSNFESNLGNGGTDGGHTGASGSVFGGESSCSSSAFQGNHWMGNGIDSPVIVSPDAGPSSFSGAATNSYFSPIPTGSSTDAMHEERMEDSTGYGRSHAMEWSNAPPVITKVETPPLAPINMVYGSQQMYSPHSQVPTSNLLQVPSPADDYPAPSPPVRRVRGLSRARSFPSDHVANVYPPISTISTHMYQPMISPHSLTPHSMSPPTPSPLSQHGVFSSSHHFQATATPPQQSPIQRPHHQHHDSYGQWIGHTIPDATGYGVPPPMHYASPSSEHHHPYPHHRHSQSSLHHLPQHSHHHQPSQAISSDHVAPGLIMSSQTGLSRRRVAGASTSNDGDEDMNPSGSTNVSPRPGLASTSTSSSYNDLQPNGSGGPRASHAGTALEGGSKVAYDPRDLVGVGSGGEEDGTTPRFTLLEEILLLGIKDRATGETILDEALKMMKAHQEGPGNGVPGEKLTVGSWVDLLSGETWNVMKIGFQLKQVRERLAKGLVDKGVLRTEKRNFLLFDMATHPVADSAVKESIMSRVVAVLTARTTTIPPAALPGAAIKGSYSSPAQPNIAFPITRTVALVCAAYAASVLDNALVRLGYDEREAAFSRCDDILNEFTVWPLGSGNASNVSRRQIASGSSGPSSKQLIDALVQAVKAEMVGGREGDDLHFEIVVTVFEIFSRMDSLL